MTNTLYISDDKRVTVDKLKKTSENKDGFFESNKDIFVFAAAIGFNHNQPRALSNTKGGEIKLDVFTQENKYYIDVIAVSTTLDENNIEAGDVNLLSWKDEEAVDKKLKIFQEYANGGLEILDRELIQNKTSIYDNILQLIYREANIEQNRGSKIGNLEGMISEI